MTEAGGLELRIFPRDGHAWDAGHARIPPSRLTPIMNMFLREQDGETFESIPVAAYTRAFQYLWHYLEFPAIGHE